MACLPLRAGLAAGMFGLLVLTVPAGAAGHRDRAALAERDPPEGFQPRLSAEAGVLCVKQCPNDALPCDPPSYKVADGRCTTQWH